LTGKHHVYPLCRFQGARGSSAPQMKTAPTRARSFKTEQREAIAHGYERSLPGRHSSRVPRPIVERHGCHITMLTGRGPAVLITAKPLERR